MRQALNDKLGPKYGDFVVRGKEASRLEQLSDCIFALAITMLLMSTVPPKNYSELAMFVSDMLSFAICIVFVMLIGTDIINFFFAMTSET